MAYLASLPMLNDDATHMAAVEELKRQQEEMAAQREAATRAALGVRAQQAFDAQDKAKTDAITAKVSNKLELLGFNPADSADKIAKFAKQGNAFVGDDGDVYGSREDYIFDRKRKAKLSREASLAKAKAKADEDEVKADEAGVKAAQLYIERTLGGDPDAAEILKQTKSNLAADVAKKAMQKSADAFEAASKNGREDDMKAHLEKAKQFAVILGHLNRGEKQKVYSRDAIQFAGMEADAADAAVQEDLNNTAAENRAYDTTDAQAAALQSGLARYAALDPSGKMANNPILPRLQGLEKEGLLRDKTDSAQEIARLRATASLANGAQARMLSAQGQMKDIELEREKIAGALARVNAKGANDYRLQELKDRDEWLIKRMQALSAQYISAGQQASRLGSAGMIAYSATKDSEMGQAILDYLAKNQGASGLVGAGVNYGNATTLGDAAFNQASPTAGYSSAPGLVSNPVTVPGIIRDKKTTEPGVGPTPEAMTPEQARIADMEARYAAKNKGKKDKKPAKTDKMAQYKKNISDLKGAGVQVTETANGFTFKKTDGTTMTVAKPK